MRMRMFLSVILCQSFFGNLLFARGIPRDFDPQQTIQIAGTHFDLEKLRAVMADCTQEMLDDVFVQVVHGASGLFNRSRIPEKYHAGDNLMSYYSYEVSNETACELISLSPIDFALSINVYTNDSCTEPRLIHSQMPLYMGEKGEFAYPPMYLMNLETMNCRPDPESDEEGDLCEYIVKNVSVVIGKIHGKAVPLLDMDTNISSGYTLNTVRYAQCLMDGAQK